MTNWNYLIGVYSFTVGCLSFTTDAVKSRPIRKEYLIGCLLFDIGCAFFIADVHQFDWN